MAGLALSQRLSTARVGAFVGVSAMGCSTPAQLKELGKCLDILRSPPAPGGTGKIRGVKLGEGRMKLVASISWFGDVRSVVGGWYPGNVLATVVAQVLNGTCGAVVIVRRWVPSRRLLVLKS